jgi:transcriptional regulator with XRE-family HTH domain
MSHTVFKTWREDAGWTQRDIALALNMTTTAVSNWDLGKATPQRRVWVQLAGLLKVDPKKIALAVLDVTREASTSAA